MDNHLRIARPARDLAVAERFWVEGLGLELLFRHDAEPVPDELVARLLAAGGTRVPARNPYWDRWGVTVEDPDGYRLVLSTRRWSNA